VVGTLAAGAVLIATLLAARSFPEAVVGAGAAALAYGVVRWLRTPAGTRADRAVDAAWARFGVKLAERPGSARFLTRLCLASFGRGNPDERARILTAIVQRAARKSEESEEELQLLAAARVLQVEDMGRFGRDVTAGIAALAADGFSGTLPADFAEFVVGCFRVHAHEPGEQARLRVMLAAAAFDAGLAPRDLLDVWAGAPNLKQAMVVEPHHRLGLLHGLWRVRTDRPWQAVAPADTVFELARNAPRTAARILARQADLLLHHRPDRSIEETIGPVLVCARGVSIGGVMIADPDAPVRLANADRALIFGRHRIDLPRRIPPEFPEQLSNWLRFRAEVLVPFIEGSLARGSAEAARRVLRPFCRRCLTCGSISAISAGAMGRVVSA
jgi:hypothetical protein